MPYRGKITWAGTTQHDFFTPSLAKEEMYDLISTRIESTCYSSEGGRTHCGNPLSF